MGVIDPLDPMLPVEPGSDADRILRDHRAMEALRECCGVAVSMSACGNGWVASLSVERIGGQRDVVTGIYGDDPADAILACSAAIEAASRDSSR